MLNLFFIFGAKYLYLVSVLVAMIFFYRAPAEARKEMLIRGAILFTLAFILSLVARALYFNPRPFVTERFMPLVPHAPDNGFPSDHVLLVAAIAKLIAFFNKRIALWLWLIVGVVALSRIYVGVHHLLDVAASIGIALLCAIITSKFYAKK
ncbi:MAG: phosphatase PAP2 family protein [Patescibacteria group bacterium]